MWLWPKTRTSTSGNRSAHRRSRPLASPVSWTTANRRPSISSRATSGSRSRRTPWSLLPYTPTSRRDRRSSASSRATSTQSPACTTTSTLSIAAHRDGGRSRARVGTCVSDRSTTETGTAASSQAGPSSVVDRRLVAAVPRRLELERAVRQVEVVAQAGAQRVEHPAPVAVGEHLVGDDDVRGQDRLPRGDGPGVQVVDREHAGDTQHVGADLREVDPPRR